jgi:pimeloyl-ACP methyl ester carboxylesterase
MDALGAEKAHLVGYSMGGWLSVGVAKHHPQRLASLVVGGWDLVDGTPKLPERELTFDVFMDFARHMAPHLVGWVTPQVTPGLRACFNALRQLDGAEQAVLNLGAPVMLWNGQEDHYHTPMSAFAARHGLAYVTSPGDHTAAAERPGAQALERLADFIDKA